MDAAPTGPDPAEDLALLCAAVRAAGPIALAKFRRGQQTVSESWAKSHDQSLVTETDLAVNAALREDLLGARADYGWLSEEDADDGDRLARERVFVVDPIDGTRSFAEGKPEFCFSVAVALSGRPVAAAIYAPALDSLFAASVGGGATLNGEAIRASRREQLDGADALGPRSTFREPHWPGGAPQVKTTYIQPIAYRLCMIAQGRWDLLVALKQTHEWDVAAGELIAREAGAAVTDITGAPVRYNKPAPTVQGMLASTRALQPQIHARLGLDRSD